MKYSDKAFQLALFDEFFKYSKMAEQQFYINQGSNFDTANFNDSLLVFKKKEMLERARRSILRSYDFDNKTMIPAVDALLRDSHIGTLSTVLDEIRKAFATVLISEQPRVNEVIENVLRPYALSIYSDQEFVKLAQTVVTNLFDWSVQVNSINKSNEVYKYLVSGEKLREIITFLRSTRNRISKDANHPLAGNEIIRILKYQINDRKGGANNLMLANRDNKVYDQNKIIAGFQELKEYLNDPEINKGHIYDDIKLIAILQSGLSNSKVSFTQLLPYEDIKDIYNSTLSKLASSTDFDINDFEKLNALQRNNFSNTNIVPSKRSRWEIGRAHV